MNGLSKQSPQFGGGGGGTTTLGTKFTPGVDPSTSAYFTNTLANQRLAYLSQIAQLKQQTGQVAGQNQFDQQAIRHNEIQGIAQQETGALDRGVVGGSQDVVNRNDIHGQAAFQGQQSQFQTDQQLQALMLQRMQAQNQWGVDQAGYQSRMLASQQEEAVNAFQQGVLGSGGVNPQRWNQMVQHQMAGQPTPQPGNVFPTNLYHTMMQQAAPGPQRRQVRRRYGTGGGYIPPTIPQTGPGNGGLTNPFGRF
jgi:hypothetical protein